MKSKKYKPLEKTFKDIRKKIDAFKRDINEIQS